MKPISRGQALAFSGFAYFVLIYAAGFLFGTLREYALRPNFDELTALLIEAPVMLAVSYVCARFIVKRTGGAGGPISAAQRLAIGLIAVGLLLVAEALLSMALRGWSFSDWLVHFQSLTGAISLVLFALVTLMPVLVRHR